MLGYLVGITLVLTAISPLIFTDVFADSFVVDFDKQLYHLDDTLTISGQILDFKMPVIAMSVYDPFGMPTGFYIVPIDSDLECSTSFPV